MPFFSSQEWRVVGLSFALVLGFYQNQAIAHFQLNVNLRIIHVQHLDGGLRVFLRLPLAYVLAQRVGPEQADGSRTPAPYTYSRYEDGQWLHYVDVPALQQPEALGQFIADGHSLRINGQPLSPIIEDVQAYPALQQPPFATLQEALQTSALAQVFPSDSAGGFVGDTVVDVVLYYRINSSIGSSSTREYEFSSTLVPGLEGQEETANLLLDHYPGDTLIFRERGLLQTPINVSRSLFAAAWTFIEQGVVHILQGLDHVLFVLCLIIGALSLRDLIGRVTGFTLGHTVTLSLGFFGLVPSHTWFIPVVETGIALSIVYAAISALMQVQQRATVWVTIAIGLLHGLGFSFVLREILRVDAPNIWQSLLAFNIGVELGQLAIVILIWPFFWYTSQHWQRLHTIAQWSLALPCIMLASYWSSERFLLLINSL